MTTGMGGQNVLLAEVIKKMKDYYFNSEIFADNFQDLEIQI